MSSQSESAPPLEQAALDAVRDMAGGFIRTQVLFTAATLGIADRLAQGALKAEDVAAALGVHSQALHRFLRMMTVLNLLTQTSDGAFSLSATGQLLRTDHPQSLRDRVLYIGRVNYPTAQGMLYAVQTGKPAFDHVFGTPLFDYLGQHADIGALFNNLMSEAVRDRVDGLIAAYDFGSVTEVVDIGGGDGALMAVLLRKNAAIRGVLFDSSKVVAAGQRRLTAENLGNRCQFVAGDFFADALPPHRDVYVLSNVIHDWDDNEAARILNNCRVAMRDDSKLLLVEELLPELVAEAPATAASDFGMLLLTGGRERTESEYRALLASANLRVAELRRFEPTRTYRGRRGNWAVIEAVCAAS